MNQININEIQSHLLMMLKQFHILCEENGLRYYIIGGTCLGAKRHNGFIPWDDDVDVGMPRPDYNKLCSLAREKLPDNLELRYYRNTNGSPFCFVKLVDNKTTLIEQAYKDYIEGLYIDVFPFDGIKMSRWNVLEKIRWEDIWFRKVMILYNRMTVTRDSFLKKILIKIAKRIDLYTMQENIDKKMMKYSFEKSDYVINFLGAYKYREVLKKSVLGEPKLYNFEDTQLYGPENIDEFLTQIYGDYMKLPPVESRVFKHDYYYLDLNKPFREYMREKK